MAVEPRRGCGYRKVGGLYIVTLGTGRGCGRMPTRAAACPTCNQGLKPFRGWGWIDSQPVFGDRACSTPGNCAGCPLADGNVAELGPVGLIWVGGKYYRSPRDFLKEAAHLGISRRISGVPKGLVLNETWVCFGHRQTEFGDGSVGPGLFYLGRPTAIEKLVTESQARDAAEMEKLAKRGITPVVVPDDDPDHNPAGAPLGEVDDDDLVEAAE
jgi:hypothetical protein